DAVLQAISAMTTGIYTITVGSAGGTTGTTTIQALLNAAVESESHNGAANNTRTTAHNLNGSITDLGGTSAQAAVVGTSDVSDQYASTVIAFSSQYSTTSWSASRALGAPNVTSYADNSNAWAPVAQNGTAESITVGFATPVLATGVTIRETWGNGFVTRVDALDMSDVLHTVWTGVDPSQ